MIKKITTIFLVLTLILSLFPCIVSANTQFTKDDILGSWYGQYTGYSGTVNVERYMNMTITSCDDNGNFEGIASVTTVENQGFDYQWIKYYFKGSVNFNNNYFHMQGDNKIGSDATGNWSFADFHGYLQPNTENEIYVSGLVNNDPIKLFSFAHTSEWAKQEITEANINDLIPDTMKNKDLSKPVTRAEFAAIANQLFETLSGTPTPITYSTFTDIAGNPDEESIKKAHSLNITVGYSDTIFGPNDLITREQLATMLCRTVKKFKYSDWTFEKDSDYYLDIAGVKRYADDYLISDYARQSIYYMTKMGIIKGFEGNIFAPQNTTIGDLANDYAIATREQALVMSLRIYKNINNFFK